MIEIECTTLDAFRQSRPASETVEVVKMDVEGFEIACLQGSSQLTTEDRPVFLIEYGIEAGRPNSFEALGDFVDNHGFEIFAMIRQSQSWLKFSTNLELTQASQLPQQDHKMLFLVPQEDAYFKKRCTDPFNFESLVKAS